MRFGYWMPVFGGWLRNVADEGMSTDWSYLRALAVESEQAGFDLTLIAELNLNDIKGHRAPSLDAWTLAPCLHRRVRLSTRRSKLVCGSRGSRSKDQLHAIGDRCGLTTRSS